MKVAFSTIFCQLIALLFSTGSVVSQCANAVTNDVIYLGVVIPTLSPQSGAASTTVLRALKTYEEIVARRMLAKGMPTINITLSPHAGGSANAFRAAFTLVDSDVNKTIGALFGSLVGDDTTAMTYVSSFAQMPHIDVGATAASLSDKVRYPFFVRGQQSAGAFGRIWAQAFHAMGIRVASVLREDTAYGASYEPFVQEANLLGIEIKSVYKIPAFSGATVNGAADMDVYKNAWVSLNSTQARFIVTFVGTVNLVRTLVAAKELGLMGPGVEDPYILAGLSRTEWQVNIGTRATEASAKNVSIFDPMSLSPNVSATGAAWGLPNGTTVADLIGLAKGNLNMGNEFGYVNQTQRDEHFAVFNELYPTLSAPANLAFAGPLACDAYLTLEEAVTRMIRAGHGCQIAGPKRSGSTFLSYITSSNFTGCTGRVTYDQNYDRLFLIDVEYVDSDVAAGTVTSHPLITYDSFLDVNQTTSDDTSRRRLLNHVNGSAMTNFRSFATGQLLTMDQVKGLFETVVTWANDRPGIPYDGAPAPPAPTSSNSEVNKAAIAIPIAVGVPLLLAVLALIFVVNRKEEPRTLEQGDPVDIVFEALAADTPLYRIHHGLYRGLRVMVQTYLSASAKHDFPTATTTITIQRSGIKECTPERMVHGNGNLVTIGDQRERSVPSEAHTVTLDRIADDQRRRRVQRHASLPILDMTPSRTPVESDSPKASEMSKGLGAMLGSLFGGGHAPRGKNASSTSTYAYQPASSDPLSNSYSGSAASAFENALKGLYLRHPLVSRMFDVPRILELLTPLRSSHVVMATDTIVADKEKAKYIVREHMQGGNLADLRETQLFELRDPLFRIRLITDVARAVLFLRGFSSAADDPFGRRTSHASSSAYAPPSQSPGDCTTSASTSLSGGAGTKEGALGAGRSRRNRRTSLSARPDPRGLGWRDLHGRIFPSNIFFDEGMGAKLGVDLGLPLASPLELLTFSAPEVVTKGDLSSAADVYSLGILIYDLFATKALWEEFDQTRLIQALAAGQLRPDISKLPASTPEAIKDLIVACTAHTPAIRPEPDMLLKELERIQLQVVAEQSAKPQSNAPLDYAFPPDVKRALLEGRKVEPKTYECVSVFFSDIVSYTTISAELGNDKTLAMLDRLYTALDRLTEELKLYKAETIGDAYMCIGGLHFPSGGPDHTLRVVKFACKAIETASQVLLDDEHPEKGTVRMRVGINVGSVVASVVGTLNPKYCLFGSTVNVASRMESTSEPMRIHLSDAAREELLRQCPALEPMIEGRGVIEVKGCGRMTTFFFNSDGSFPTSAG